jgi:hypothetical protein
MLTFFIGCIAAVCINFFLLWIAVMWESLTDDQQARQMKEFDALARIPPIHRRPYVPTNA